MKQIKPIMNPSSLLSRKLSSKKGILTLNYKCHINRRMQMSMNWSLKKIFLSISIFTSICYLVDIQYIFANRSNDHSDLPVYNYLYFFKTRFFSFCQILPWKTHFRECVLITSDLWTIKAYIISSLVLCLEIALTF